MGDNAWVKSPIVVAAIVIAITTAACQSDVIDRAPARPADTTPPPGLAIAARPPAGYEPLVIAGPLTDDGVTLLISNYLPAHLAETPFGGEAFCSHDQYGWEQTGTTATVWMWAFCAEYSTVSGDNMVPSGDLWIGSAGGGPVVASLSKGDEGWQVSTYRMLMSLNTELVRELFPAEYAELVLRHEPRRSLSQEAEHAARSQLAS